jgi:hypothetical protein
MAFALIRPESRLYLGTPQESDARTSDSQRAAVALRADYERWSRWLLGLLAFLLAAGGTFVAVGLTETVRMLGGVPHAVDLIAIAISAAIGVAGIAVLIALWSSGRQLLNAASSWIRLPSVRSGARRGVGGWVQARAVNLEPRVLARLISGTLALLLAIGGAALVVRDLTGQFTSMTLASAVVSLVALIAGVGQIGGVMRLVSALAEADPLWVRIRSAFGRN